MLKRKALMESISSNLHNFLKKIGNNLSVPDKILSFWPLFIKSLSLQINAVCW